LFLVYATPDILEAGIEGIGILLAAAVDPLIDVIVWVGVAVILGKWTLEGLLDMLTTFWPSPWPFRRTTTEGNSAAG
jgi:hypothetical protein